MTSDPTLGALLAAAVSWRWLLQIALLSGGLAVACRFAYADDPRSRRALGQMAVTLLALVPPLLLVWQPRWQVGVTELPVLPVPPDLPAVLLGIWLLIAVPGSVAVLWRVRRTRRVLLALPRCNDSAVLAMARRLCVQLRMPVPTVLVGEQCCASSMGAPLLVVAHDFDAWSPAAQRAALAHELVHLRRQDDRWLLALAVLQCAYLFCPWLRGLRSRLLQAIEESCDDAAASLLGNRRGYFDGLAHALLGERAHPGLVNVSRAAAGSLAQRLQRLVAGSSWHEVQSGSMLAGLAFGLSLLLLATTFELVIAAPVQEAARPRATLVALASAADSPAAEGGAAARGEVTPRVTVVPARSRWLHKEYAPRVIYPGQALLERVEGAVLVSFYVAGDGTVVRARVVASSPASVFDEAALRAARQTRYRPSGRRSAHAVETLYRFNLAQSRY